MGDASRSELSNLAFRCPNAKRAPGRGVRPYTARCASLRGRPPLTTSDASRWSACIPDPDPVRVRTAPTATHNELALAPLALGFAPAAPARADGAHLPRAQGPAAAVQGGDRADKSKAQANKAKFPKGKKTLDIGDWLVRMEGSQKLKGDKVVGSGHSFAKQKFSTKKMFDSVFGTNKEMWE